MNTACFAVTILWFQSLDYIHHSFSWEYDLMVVTMLLKISKCSSEDPGFSPAPDIGSWSDRKSLDLLAFHFLISKAGHLDDIIINGTLSESVKTMITQNYIISRILNLEIPFCDHNHQFFSFPLTHNESVLHTGHIFNSFNPFCFSFL